MKLVLVPPLLAVLSTSALAQEVRVAAPLPPADFTKRPPAPEAPVESHARPFDREALRAQPAPLAPSAATKQGSTAQPAALPPFDRKQVHHSSEDDGTPWVRGETYKARFGSEGASYIPFLGSAAPQNFPLDLHLAGVALGGEPLSFDASVAAKREGETMRYDRGSLRELYTIDVDSIEQTFVFDTLPAGASGELVLRIAATSELAGQRLDDRIEFANELGAVRYGLATALDANGAHIPAETTLDGGEIVIRVPADFVSAAKLPLTIDPVIFTYSIDTGTPNAFQPDCSYDCSGFCWLVVHEEVFSATDHDIVWRRIGDGGFSGGSGYLDSVLSSYWANPACANNNAGNCFYVVAQVGLPTSGLRKIYGRTVSSLTGALGTVLDIGAQDPLVDLVNPDVGGDPHAGGPSYFCVVWEKRYSSTDRDIFYRMVDPNGAAAGWFQPIDVTSGTYDTEPSISKSDDTSIWNVVWQRTNLISPIQQDVRGARIYWSGGLVVSSFAIDTSTANTASPKASSSLAGSNRWAVVYQRDTGTDWDVEVRLMDIDTTTDVLNLSVVETLAGNLGTLLENQVQPDIDTDGRSFAIAYTQSFQGSPTNYDVYVSSVAPVGNQLQLSEGPYLIAGTNFPEFHPSIASAESSGLVSRNELVVLDSATSSSTSGDILGGLYANTLYTSFCNPTYDAVPACPCGNAPAGYGRGCNNSPNTGGAQLVAAGISSVYNESMTLVSQFEPASALTVIYQSNTLLGTPILAGQGVRCVGGSMKRLYTRSASGGVVSVPALGDLSIYDRSSALGDSIQPGTPRYYFSYYRDPIVLGGCAPTSVFNLSQTVQAIWIP